MCTRTIAGLTWRVRSPSEYKLEGYPIWVVRDEQGWFISGANAVYGEADSLNQAAQALAKAMGLQGRRI